MSDYDLKSSVTMTNAASPTLQKVQTDLDATGRKFDSLGKEVSKANSGLTSLGGVVGLLGLSFSAVKIAQTAYELGNLGSVAITTEKAFRNVMAAAGQSATILNEYKAAADGTIGSTALMRAANLALAGTTGELSTEMARLLPTLIEGARAASALNPAYGDAQFMLDSLVSGVKRASPRLIDNTGIVLKLGEANQSLADKLGKSVDELTSTEQSLAILYATAEAVPTLVGQVGDAMDETATASTRLAVAWSGLRTAIGKELSPGTVAAQSGLTLFLNQVTDIISGDRVSRTTAQIAGLRQELDDINNLPVNAGIALSGGRAFFSAEDKIAAINSVREELNRLEGVLSESRTTWAEATSEEERYIFATNAAAVSTQIFGGKAFTLSTMLAGLAARLDATATKARKASDALAAGAIKSITGGLLGATDVISLKDYTQNVGAAGTAVTVLTAALNSGAISQETYDYKIAQLTQANQDWVSGLNDSAAALDKVNSGVDDLSSKLESLISAQLQPSFSLKDLAPELSTGEGNLDEHYRRLAAIAVRGGEELTKHADDWQDTIALIPADVRAQGTGAIQAWAKDMVVAYDQGLDFSLIDRDALKQRILAQLKAGEMRDAVIAELAAELGGSVSTAKLQEAAGMAVGGTGGKDVSAGIKDSIDVSGALTLTAAAFLTGAKTFEKELKASGGAVGGVILGGITEAVTGGAPDIVKRLADALAPSVADILARNARRTGE